MKNKLLQLTGVILLLVLFWSLAVQSSESDSLPITVPMLARLRPHPPKLTYSVFRTAPILVAETFGRTNTCADADPDLVNDTANAALTVGLDPQILAATVAVESGCNPYAVSSKGAIGLTQVVPKVWAGSFDFSGGDNLLNQKTNLRVGATILSGLVRDYGVSEAVTRYQGTGIGADPNYTFKILTLARRQ